MSAIATPSGPTDTTFRLLLLSLTCATASVFAWSFNAVYLVGGELLTSSRRCADLDTAVPPGATNSPFAECFAPYYLHNTLVIVVGLLATVLVAMCAFAVAPHLLTYRRGLTPASGPASGVLASIAAEAVRAGVRVPTVLVDAGQSGATARVVAGFGQPAIVVGLGTLTLSTSKPEAFRAMIAHELAHIGNRDAWKTEAAVATWWGLVIASLVPYLVAVAATPFTAVSEAGVVMRSLFTLSAVPWVEVAKIVAITLLAVLIRNALLRAREFAADRYAADSLQVGPSLQALFAMSRQTTATWAGRLLAVHPPVGTREHHLDDRRLGAAVSPWESLTLGLLAGLTVAALTVPLSYLAHGRLDSTVLTPLGSAGVAVVMGLGLWALSWRAARAEVADRRTQLLAGVTLGLGSVASTVLLPQPSGQEPLLLLVSSPLYAIAVLVQVTLWTATALLVGELACSWLSRAARANGRRAYTALVSGGVVAAAAAALCFLVVSPMMALAATFAFQLSVPDLLILGALAAVINPYTWLFGLVGIVALAVGTTALRGGARLRHASAGKGGR